MNSISILFLSILCMDHNFSGYRYTVLCLWSFRTWIHCSSSSCFQSFHWEIRYYYDGFSFIYFFLLQLSISFFSVHFNVLTAACYEEFLLWSCLVGTLCFSCLSGRSFFSLGLYPSEITLKFWLWHSPGICLLYLCLNTKIWSFHGFSQLIPVPFPSFKNGFHILFFCCLIFLFLVLILHLSLNHLYSWAFPLSFLPGLLTFESVLVFSS